MRDGLMAATGEFEPFIRAWKRRLDRIRRRRALLAHEARREAAAAGRMLGKRFGVDAVYLLVPLLSRLAEVNDDFQEALSRFMGFVKALAEETLAR